MVRRLPQLSSTQISWFDSSISSTCHVGKPRQIMRQWFGLSANAVLNRRRTHFIDHANYKNIDSNVMDCANVTKIPTPPSANRYSPPPPPPPLTSMRCTKTISRPGMASYRKSLLASHSVMEMCFSCFMNTKYKCLRCELPICNKCSVFEENEDVCNASLLFLFFAINFQRKTR